MSAAQVVEAQARGFEGRRATEHEGKAPQLGSETQLEVRQAGQSEVEQAGRLDRTQAQLEGRQAGPLTRLFRWWLEYSLRFAEVVGAQWR